MKSPFQRIAALALCFTLTLGAFVYRPPQAEAIAGVDDAVVIGALLSAFAGGCGLIFSNNGMTSSELAQGLTDKWNEFKAAVLETDTTFAGWLGYEDMDALLQAIVFSGGDVLTLPRIVARKFAEFVDWLKSDPDVVAGGSSTVVATGVAYYISQFSTSVWNLDEDSIGLKKRYMIDVYNPANYPYHLAIENAYGFDSTRPELGTFFIMSKDPFTFFLVESDMVHETYGNLTRGAYLVGDSRFSICCFPFPRNPVDSRCFFTSSNSKKVIRLGDYGVSSEEDGAFVFTQNPDVSTPDIADDDTAPSPTITGVGDGTATTIEDLLQQILEQLQANTLAPALDVAGTETGGDTGTDEDSKPYLPYIPQIFEKIKDLPGTLSNIWETVKGIPAAIAEKIGAFFTTLWGWLQNIIDAITALPAAIAEKVGALFKPDEALVTEIVDAFKGKFGFLSTLNSFVNDLFSLTPESDPPVIWVHLENAESKYGYSYGDKQKILDLSWYQKYKASVDGILSGFLWLGYLWLLFKRAPGILNGMSLADDDAPRSADMPDMLNTPRLGAGDGSTMYRGDGFTMRDKGRRGK